MTVHDLLNLSIKKLTTSTSPQLDGEVLLSFALKKPKEYLLAHPHKNIPAKIEKQYLRLLNKRLLGWPVAYLVRNKEFFGLNFYVDKNVLIPRPETEGLVEMVLDKIKGSKKNLNIADIGTGSGCIIISVAKSIRAANSRFRFFASDVSPQAIAVARKNAKLHTVKITFANGNLLKPWGRQNFDVIIANLPYLAKLVDDSTKFEPKGALVAAKKGMRLYEQLFKGVAKRTVKPRYIFLEIGLDQGRITKNLAKKLLPGYETKIFKDLFGRNRYASLAKLS